jgi:hypothetical protein
VLYGLIGTVLSVVLMTVTERYKWTYKIDQLKVNPLVSFGLLIVAVVLTLNL